MSEQDGKANAWSAVGGGFMAERLTQLEHENLRLQRLVAELLAKNQQLREGLWRQEPAVA